MPSWSVRLFGTEELQYRRRSISHLPDVFWPIFGCLLATPKQQMTRSRLAGLVWPDRDEAAARHCLATALWRVRNRLPGDQRLLVIDEDAIALQLGGCWIDCAVVGERARRALAAPDLLGDVRERDRLTRALACYRGAFMPDRQVELLAIERERYRSLFLDALLQLAQAEMAGGRFERAREAARQLCEIEPLREDAQRLLMIAHLRCGNRGVALTQYRILERLLQDELGVEPMRETRDLAEQIGAGVAINGAGVQPSLLLTETDRALLLTARDYLTRSLALIDRTIGD